MRETALHFARGADELKRIRRVRRGCVGMRRHAVHVGDDLVSALISLGEIKRRR